MLKERDKVIKQATKFLDALVVVVGFFAAFFIRNYFHDLYKFDLVPSTLVVGTSVNLRRYLPTLLLWLPLWSLMLSLNGLYRSFRTHSFFEITWIIIKSAIFSALAFGSLAFILKIQFVSRVFFVIFIGMASGLLIFEKWLIFFVISHRVRRSGYNYRQLLIVGTGPRAERFVVMLRKHPEWGFKISGLIDDDPARVGKEFFGIKVIGVLKDIPRILHEEIIDEVIFIVPRTWLERIQESIADCELQGVKASVAADLFELKIARARQTDWDGFPLMIFETTFGQEWQLFIKRSVDLSASALGLIILSPVFLIVSLLIKITSPGPIFFKQKRVGLNGRIVTLYKLRSMFKDAAEQQAELEHLNEMDGPVFKIKNDPRITPLGRILRKTSIDELPQLFNVVMGHMSLIGPRPPIPEEVEKYEVWQRRRLSMRPGITCLWQAGGRNKVSFEKWMELDLEYIDNWSLWLDCKILMKTIPVVLFGIGAR